MAEHDQFPLPFSPRPPMTPELRLALQESANGYVECLGYVCGVPTWYEPAAFDGHRVLLASDLARLMYGRSDLGPLLEAVRWCAEALLLGSPPTPHTAGDADHVPYAHWEHVLCALHNGTTALAVALLKWLVGGGEPDTFYQLLAQYQAL